MLILVVFRRISVTRVLELGVGCVSKHISFVTYKITIPFRH